MSEGPGAPAGAPDVGGSARVAYARDGAAPVSGAARAVAIAMHGFLRLLTLALAAAARLAALVGPRTRPIPADGADVLLTGTFYAGNWVAAHLGPLAASRRCRRIRLVTRFAVPPIEKVHVVTPPRWLRAITGGTGARLITFAWLAIGTRPHVVGGFHLLLNGLVVLPLARLVGARSLYFCGGGPTEVLDGGVWSQNRLFTLMRTPDPVVERRLLRAVDGFDHVVTMGARAIGFFHSRGVRTSFHVISGGMDGTRYRPAPESATTDLVLVARLSAVKRVDLLLDAIARMAERRPTVSAVIVGDGPLRPELEERARRLGLAGKVSFVGHQENVALWLTRARIFVLTSDSEGLSLALMEAMLCGLPAVVSDVGDLPELVQDGVNGYLVRERSAEAFAERLLRLTDHPDRLAEFSLAARRLALRYDVQETARRWDELLGSSPERGVC